MTIAFRQRRLRLSSAWRRLRNRRHRHRRRHHRRRQDQHPAPQVRRRLLRQSHHPAHRLARRRRRGLAGDLPRGPPRPRGEAKKIIASVESVGASGAYYIASGCDKIYANDASVVGSIGVIMEWTNYGDLMKWAKLKNVVIHAGELKDAGDPTRDVTPEGAGLLPVAGR